jgi:hypothetical protein
MRRLLTAAAAALLALSAHADVLCMKDGRVVDGKKLTRVENGVKIAFENGEVLVSSELIQDVLIEGEALAPPANPEEEAQRAKGMIRFEGKWMTPKSREELLKKRLDERKQAFAELQAHSEWRNRLKEKTRNFAFEYTLPPHVFEGYRDLMEAYFTQFVKDWKIKLPKDLEPLPVCLYRDHDSFLQTAGAGSNTLGYYKFTKPREANFFYERVDPALTEWVMFHESNHYLQNLLDLDFSMPHFPGESVAEYYGGSTWDPVKKKLTTGRILERRLVEIQTDMAEGAMMPLERLVTTDGMYEHYTWGWSLVHFAMNDKRYQPKFQKFVTTLVSGKDVRRESMGVDNLRTVSSHEVWTVFRRCMDLDDAKALAAFEDEWHAYVKDKLQLVTTRGKEEAAYQAAREGRPLRATRFFKAALEDGTRNPLTYHRYADMLAEQGDLKQALEMWKRAQELGPLEGDFYWRMGRAVRVKGDKKEGSRLMKLAKEIEPEGQYFDIELEEELKEKAKGG